MQIEVNELVIRESVIKESVNVHFIILCMVGRMLFNVASTYRRCLPKCLPLCIEPCQASCHDVDLQLLAPESVHARLS